MVTLRCHPSQGANVAAQNSAREEAGPIVGFFRNESADNSGRKLREILAWPDERLEYTHNFIQWLFPTREKSPVNPDAPTVDDAAIAAFNADPRLRESLTAAFDRMAAFYGFEVQDPHGNPRVVKSRNWPQRSANWLAPRNHNMLRITRIITSLRLLGLEPLALAFFAALDELNSSDEGKAIGPVTYGFWKSAASR
jgi:hypothetical protein